MITALATSAKTSADLQTERGSRKEHLGKEMRWEAWWYGSQRPIIKALTTTIPWRKWPCLSFPACLQTRSQTQPPGISDPEGQAPSVLPAICERAADNGEHCTAPSRAWLSTWFPGRCTLVPSSKQRKIIHLGTIKRDHKKNT